MKFEDVVIYSHAGVESKALVVRSNLQPTVIQPQDADPEAPPVTEEHLTLLVLDPGAEVKLLSGLELSNSIKVLMDVLPLKVEGAAGWKPLPEGDDAVALKDEQIADLEADKATLKQQVDDADKRAAEAQTAQKEAEAKLASTEDRIATDSDNIKSLTAELQSAKEDYSSALVTIESREAQIASLQAELDNTKSELAAAVDPALATPSTTETE